MKLKMEIVKWEDPNPPPNFTQSEIFLKVIEATVLLVVLFTRIFFRI